MFSGLYCRCLPLEASNITAHISYTAAYLYVGMQSLRGESRINDDGIIASRRNIAGVATVTKRVIILIASRHVIYMGCCA